MCTKAHITRAAARDVAAKIDTRGVLQISSSEYRSHTFEQAGRYSRLLQRCCQVLQSVAIVAHRHVALPGGSEVLRPPIHSIIDDCAVIVVRAKFRNGAGGRVPP